MSQLMINIRSIRVPHFVFSQRSMLVQNCDKTVLELRGHGVYTVLFKN